MADIALKYDIFEQYLKKAKDCELKGDKATAKRFYLLAAKEMLEIAELNKGALKESSYERAKNIINKANQLLPASNDLKIEEKKDEQEENSLKTEDVSLEDALAELNALVGLDKVKEQVNSWVNQIKVFALRAENGVKNPTMSYHLVFTGNPGTGKTTVARIVAKIYHALGILSKGQLVEVTDKDLIAGYVGQTAIQTNAIIKKAMGGILFIDEAYGLVSEGNKDFGTEAINTILKAMEDHRDDFVVIAAGYKKEMESFIHSNPGLASRFKTFINFEDYKPDDLYRIFMSLSSNYDYHMDEQTKSAIFMHLTEAYKKGLTATGNGRYVRNLFESMVTNQANRVNKSGLTDKESLTEFKASDLPMEAM